MLNSIRFLEQIQKIDIEIAAVKDDEKRYLDDIAARTEELNAAREQKKTLLNELESITAQIKEIELKIKESQDKASKDEKRINEIKNQKELNALTREIAAANKTRKQGEQDKAQFDTKASEKSALIKAKEEVLTEKEAEIKRLNGELDAKRPVWKEDIDKKNQLKETLKADIRPDIYKKYAAIKEKRGGIGLVPIKNETCQGCYIHIPPQTYIQLKRGTEELISCPHCHRILYVETQTRTEAV